MIVCAHDTNAPAHGVPARRAAGALIVVPAARLATPERG
jgi:hypothetical protein